MTDELRGTLEALLALVYDQEATPARRVEAAELWFGLMPAEEPGARWLREERRRKRCATPGDEELAGLDAFLALHGGHVAGLLAAALGGVPAKIHNWECSPPRGWTPPSTLAL